MAKIRRVVIPNPEDDGDTLLRVRFAVHMPEVYAGICEEVGESPWDEDEPNIEISIRSIEELEDEDDDDPIDVSKSWMRNPLLDEVEELVKEAYIERQRVRYVDRMSNRG
jgi:hypothetical protein